MSPNPVNTLGLGPWMSPNAFKFTWFGAMDVAKPYNSIGFGAMDVTKPHKSTDPDTTHGLERPPKFGPPVFLSSGHLGFTCTEMSAK